MNEEITVIGQTNFRGQHRPFGIYPDDRRRHIYIIGKTGVGKTTMLETMLLQDIRGGKGVALVDPHGDIAERVVDMIPQERTNDVVYFDPADVEYPVAFNVLEAVDPEYKYLVASGLVSSLKKIWADSWGPRLEYILRNTILALLDYPSSTMLGILRMLGDKTYRKKVINQIKDPVVKAFWINEFANYNERFRAEAISPIQNKVGQFLTSAIIRNIVAQPKSTIDMKDVMDNSKILIINVSKGRIGEDNSSLLGAMLITKLQLAAMDRAKITERQRKDFYLYVDEFQNFATESFAAILSEARKYRLNLIIAHQYINQMEEEVRDAVFGNVGTLVSFRVGAFDAEFLEKEFMPEFTESDLVNLDKYNAYIKLMIDGVTSSPFSIQTIPPIGETLRSRDKVINVSRERYGRRREIVEDRIARWSGVTFKGTAEAERASDDIGAQRVRQRTPIEQPEALEDIVLEQPQEVITDLGEVLKTQQRQKSKGKATGRDTAKDDSTSEVFEATCSTCGRKTQVPFVPDPEKEVYCKACFEDKKAQRKKEREQTASPQSKQQSPFVGPKPPTI